MPDSQLPVGRREEDELLTNVTEEEVRDVELVVKLLQGRLEPDKATVVRQRIKDDQAFHDFVAPLAVAFAVADLPPARATEAEMQRDWDAFTEKAGFAFQKRKARKRWIVG